jgi:hypothetical protein
MKEQLMTLFSRKSAAAILAVASMTATANAAFIAKFDGADSAPHAFTNTSGAPGSIQNGGPTGNYARITTLTGSNNNSIAFDEVASQTGPAPAGLKMAFDFRMSNDADNAAAGGCCDSAADGMGIGLFATATYGTSGANNPATLAGQPSNIWERPAFKDAFTVGLDIFQNIDVMTLNFAGVQVAEFDIAPIMDLNNNLFHRAVIDLKPNGAGALADVALIEDVQGATIIHNVASNVAVPGMTLAALPGYRVIAGGRTGGAFVAGDIDNIFVSTNPVPEPASLSLLGLAGLSMLSVRRRK